MMAVNRSEMLAMSELEAVTLSLKPLSICVSPEEGGAESRLGLARGCSPGLRVWRLGTWTVSANQNTRGDGMTNQRSV